MLAISLNEAVHLRSRVEVAARAEKLTFVRVALVLLFFLGASAGVSSAQTFTTQHNFCSQSGCVDGAFPYTMTLIQGADGNFYGTTTQGGSHNGGTVFKMTPDGTLTALYNFCSKFKSRACKDGFGPPTGLVQGPNGDLYGTTEFGGAFSTQDNYSMGSVFKLTPGGKLTTLHSFCADPSCTDGQDPYAGLVLASDGNLYGTTAGGGANSFGTIFRVTPTGNFTSLYSFCSDHYCPEGIEPFGTLIQASNGNFYGTTTGAEATRQEQFSSSHSRAN